MGPGSTQLMLGLICLILDNTQHNQSQHHRLSPQYIIQRIRRRLLRHLPAATCLIPGNTQHNRSQHHRLLPQQVVQRIRWRLLRHWPAATCGGQQVPASIVSLHSPHPRLSKHCTPCPKARLLGWHTHHRGTHSHGTASHSRGGGPHSHSTASRGVHSHHTHGLRLVEAGRPRGSHLVASSSHLVHGRSPFLRGIQETVKGTEIWLWLLCAHAWRVHAHGTKTGPLLLHAEGRSHLTESHARCLAGAEATSAAHTHGHTCAAAVRPAGPGAPRTVCVVGRLLHFVLTHAGGLHSVHVWFHQGCSQVFGGAAWLVPSTGFCWLCTGGGGVKGRLGLEALLLLLLLCQPLLLFQA